ncbi:CBS domain-containing protein [Candidatus Woesearchaeota archaeon]|nr:CBS domain-containing protein [Candidatus Woesearchaeota archaeon]
MVKAIVVSDILSTQFSTIDENEPVSKALGKFTSLRPKPYLLIVLDKRKRYKGLITERDIVRTNFQPKAKVSELIARLMRRFPIVSPDRTITEATRLMLENELKYLPIIEKGKVKGIIRDIDILDKVVKTNFGNEPVEKYVTREPYVLAPDDTVGKALNLFRENNISRAPVVERGKILGILTMHNIAVKFLQPKVKEGRGELAGESMKYIRFPVKGIMTSLVITCSMKEKVKAVVKKMLRHDITAVVAVDNKGRLEGIVAKKDLLESIASLVKPPVQKFFIQVAGELGALDSFDKESVSNDLQAFVNQYDPKFNEGHLYVYIQLQREKTRNKRQFYCKVNFTTDKGRFHSGEKGWGVEQALSKSLREIERQIEKKLGKQIHRTPRKGLYPSRIK